MAQIKTNRVQVTLTRKAIEKATVLGEGRLSLGLELAVRAACPDSGSIPSEEGGSGSPVERVEDVSSREQPPASSPGVRAEENTGEVQDEGFYERFRAAQRRAANGHADDEIPY